MILDKIKKAGIVGAGGAGFPTHIKASSKAKILVANAAECEPLIHKDFELILNYPERVIDGILLMMESIGAEKGIIGIKEKNEKAIVAINKELKKNDKISVHLLQDIYPAGDEYVLVYECTGKLIPIGGIPLDIGVVVTNVETLYNISLSNDDIPVTEKFLSVSGAVKNPVSFFAPIGMSFKDVIKIAGNATIQDFAIFVGGVMMGELTFDLSRRVTKTTSGLIILPKGHKLVKRRNQLDKNYRRIGKSACDQCSYCTELCPRYLLGHYVQPHKVMRSLVFTKSGEDFWNEFSFSCSSCGLCTLSSCPEDLFPREICSMSKLKMQNEQKKIEKNFQIKIHPLYKNRQTPIKRLMRKLDLEKYNTKNPFIKCDYKPTSVIINLKQGVGDFSTPVIEQGKEVVKGELIAKISENKLGANQHSSINGFIKKVNKEFIEIYSSNIY
jgi:Na+-translocating ferredoxin:NAD+ oxidoreductase RnfC subunit